MSNVNFVLLIDDQEENVNHKNCYFSIDHINGLNYEINERLDPN